MKIFIIRHGETDSNKFKKLQGQRIDESLNAEGIRQANDLAATFHKNDFDVIFTSPLRRARETAEIIAKKITAPIIVKNEITERDFGDMSGKTWDEMLKEVKSNVDLKGLDFEQKYDYRPYGGESVEDVKNRLLKFTNELKKDYSDKKVLVVAHGGILKLANMIFSKEILEKTPDNGTVSEYDI